MSVILSKINQTGEVTSRGTPHGKFIRWVVVLGRLENLSPARSRSQSVGKTGSTPGASKAFQPQRCGLISITVIAPGYLATRQTAMFAPSPLGCCPGFARAPEAGWPNAVGGPPCHSSNHCLFPFDLGRVLKPRCSVLHHALFKSRASSRIAGVTSASSTRTE